MTAEHRFPLALLAAFTRALAHRIRTPLAVISNELSFLAAENPQGTAVASARTKEITDILRSACRISVTGGCRERVPLTALFNKLPPDGEGVCIEGEIALLKVAFDSLQEVLARYAAAPTPLEIAVHAKQSEPLQIVLRADWHTGAAAIEPCASVSEFISERLGLDSIEAPLFDAIMHAHGAQTVVSCDGMRVMVALTLPAVC